MNKYLTLLPLKNILLIIFSFIIFNSCETFCESSLFNKTGHDINLTISFNKSVMQKAWRKDPYIPFVKQYGVDSAVILEKFDSLNLINYYKVKNNGVFYMSGGMRDKPTYNMFVSFMVINGEDTIVLKTQNDYDKYFVEKHGNGSFDWILK